MAGSQEKKSCDQREEIRGRLHDRQDEESPSLEEEEHKDRVQDPDGDVHEILGGVELPSIEDAGKERVEEHNQDIETDNEKEKP